MSIFRFPLKKWFSRKKDSIQTSLEEPNGLESLAVVSEVEIPPEDRSKMLIRRYSTHISATSNSLEGYLSQSYEELGYDDAFDHPDIEYLNVGKRYLVSNMKSLLKKAIESFTFDRTELEYAIKTHEKLGEMDTVGFLKARLIKFDLKLKGINDFLEDMQANNGESERVLLSYERGFRKGLAEITRSKFK